MNNQNMQAGGLQLPNFNFIWSNITQDLKKLYNQCLDSQYKVVKCETTLYFLKQCTQKQIVPKTFKVKNFPDQRFSEGGRTKWLRNLRNLECQNVKLAMREQECLKMKKEREFKEQKKKTIASFPLQYQEIVQEQIDNRRKEIHVREMTNIRAKISSLTFQPPEPSSPTRSGGEGEEGGAGVALAGSVPLNPSNPDKKKNRRFIKRSRYRRKMRKNARQIPDSLVINYSSKPLTDGQKGLLQKHLSFCPLPDKLNKTQLTYDLARFGRTLRWKEVFKDEERPETETIIPQKKHNLPKNAPSSTLSKFLYGVGTDLLYSKPNKSYPNLTTEESTALKELVNAQREGDIIIQRCDKGGATAIMNRQDYIKEISEQHLQAYVINETGKQVPVYREVDPLMLGVHHSRIKQFAEDAATEGFITAETARRLIPEQPSEGRAYGLVKAHKPVEQNKNIPPLRLVVSGSGSNTENASLFVDYHCKHIPASLPSHIQDTPDFLRMLEEENRSSSQPDNSFPVTIDVVGLYPNIPQQEGMRAFYKKIVDPQYRDQTVPASFLMLLLQCVLQCNIFTFDERYFLQEWGTSIGTRVAPTYANIFMGYLEEKILQGWTTLPSFQFLPKLWKRFIDDIFTIWKGTENELLLFLTYMNTFHTTIKFTAEYRNKTEQVKVSWKEENLCISRRPLGGMKPRSVDFLDTTVWIDDNGKFQTDLYRKETDRITYLLPSSAHPGHITKNIPYSLGYRLLRICSRPEDFQSRKSELISHLKSRGYKEKVLNPAFVRLESITREQALQKVLRVKTNDRSVLALTYDPRLPSATGILKKHYVVASENPTFKETFPELPLVGYRRSKNLGEYLTRSKLYPISRGGLRTRAGFQTCTRIAGGQCTMCKYSANSTSHTAAATKEKFAIQSRISCTDKYIIYSVSCKKCPKIQYIGQSTQPAASRFCNHLSDITTQKLQKPVGAHFNLPGHTASDMVFLPFEKLRIQDKTMLDVRERFWIEKKKTFLYGLNRC